MNAALMALGLLAVLSALGVVAVLVLTLCGELLAHWRREDF